MNYFVRFIKTDDELREGGWYYNPYLNVYHQHRISEGIGGPILGSYNVKPFLCTEDAEIGQISITAKWIKEYDEFDETEVKFFISDQPPFEGDEETTYEKYKEWPTLKKIKLKGPCGHFH